MFRSFLIIALLLTDLQLIAGSNDDTKRIKKILSSVAVTDKKATVEEQYLYRDAYNEDHDISIRKVKGEVVGFEMNPRWMPMPWIAEYYYDDAGKLMFLRYTNPTDADTKYVEEYYLSEGNPFHYRRWEHKGGEMKMLNDDVFKAFTEEQGFPLYWNIEHLESLLKKSTIFDDILNLEDFTMDPESRFIAGSELPDDIEPIKGGNIYFFNNDEEFSVKTTLDEITIVAGRFGGDEFMFSIKGYADALGKFGKYVLLSEAGTVESWGGIVYDTDSKNMYETSVREIMIKNGKLYILTRLEEEQMDRISYNPDCSNVDTDNFIPGYYGVYYIAFGTSDEIFTNQVFCLHDQ